MYPPPSSTTSSSTNSAQKPDGLTRYCSAPGSFLTKAVDSVIGTDEGRRQFYAANIGNHNSNNNNNSKYFSGGGESFSSSQLTSESVSRVNSSVDHKPSGGGGGGDQLKRSDALNAIARGAAVPSSSSSSLLRQKSSPAGFLSNLVSESGFSITRGGSGGFESHNNAAPNGGGGGYQPVQRLKSQLSFTGPESTLSQISEASESDDMDVETGRSSGNGGGRLSSSYNNPAGFVMEAWDHNPNSITFSGQPSKKFRAMDGDIYTCFNGLETQYSMPQTTLEMATVGGLHIPEDSVPCKVRAKRGCATHPRSIAERERRTRISGRLKKLQDLVPNMDKQTSYSDMLDLAVQHIKGLQTELEKLHEDMENCTCGCRPCK